MQTTSNWQLEKQFRKSRRGTFAWIAALERLIAQITILRVPSLGDLYLADRVSGTLEHVAHLELMHTLRSRVMQDVVVTRQENHAVNTLIEPLTRVDLDTTSCSTLLSDHRYHIITHFIIIIHHYNRHHSFKPSLPSSLLSRTINIMIITIIIIISQIIIILSSFIISSSLFTNVIIITLSYHLYDNHYL